MELRRALRTTGSVREFTDAPVDDEVLFEILDDARFAPQAATGRRGASSSCSDPDSVVRSRRPTSTPGTTTSRRCSPVSSRSRRSRAMRSVARSRHDERGAIAMSNPDGFAETLERRAGACSSSCADLSALRRDRPRPRSLPPRRRRVDLSLRVERPARGARARSRRCDDDGRDRERAATARRLSLPAHLAVASVVVLGYPGAERRVASQRRVGLRGRRPLRRSAFYAVGQFTRGRAPPPFACAFGIFENTRIAPKRAIPPATRHPWCSPLMNAFVTSALSGGRSAGGK